MKTYALYLESGPKKKKTMVHVLEWLGCIAKGPTTEQALAAAPDALRAFLRFLKRHGEDVHPDAPFGMRVAEHVTQGQWLGNGDPALVFQPDLDPLPPRESTALVRRLEWTRAEVLGLVGGLTAKQLDAGPKDGRPVRAILEHMLESEHFYVCSLVGRVEGLPAPGSIVKKREGDLLSWMGRVRGALIDRVWSLTPDERSRAVEHWKQTWTARKALRRMLEHEWEHLVELSERLGRKL